VGIAPAGTPCDLFAISGSGALEFAEELSQRMKDLGMLLFTAVFFALAFGYVRACQRLR
jgi:hypothetical protein